ncbi:transcription factor IIIC subunit delta N-term-domain-containing protein [Ampelomyces quisqualis]|uniref:Transcription factor IIIC subunit delta N-term-domain-containing protein n=1 Tax=Ampelomyces quisqualis TaxID=50730 RepID=A0A6A5QN79_AMPQU|nr:transcription factor IIIC subunit delta N-term-domain-containing protein [Ampelomyces quisqualis]
MSDVTELRCWPSCTDGLDWSQDGIIALASDERVELLFPNTVTYDRDQEVAQWQHISLQVPWFTNEELPIKEPAPLANYSIGEEISASTPIAIAWSPPGLAKHRRCALAALTANLVLSIWSNDGKPHDGACWDRRLIVNNALHEYFSIRASDLSEHADSLHDEQMRMKTRIRAFSWAPSMRNPDASSTLGTQLSWGRHMLAVCNDYNQIVVVAVESPTSTYGSNQGWSAQVLTHLSLTPDSDSEVTIPRFFRDELMQQKHISHVSWSPWYIQGEQYHSVIVYATNEDVRARIVTYRQEIFSFRDEITYPKIEMRYNGPMKWSPTVDEESLSLALFTLKGLICLKISKHDASILERSTHDLDGRWDKVSGAVWDTTHRPTPHIHFSSLLSTIQNPTAALDVSTTPFKRLDPPNWRKLIVEKAVEFSVTNDLAGNIKMKVWGLSTSPLGDFIAACHSVHPSDMIEYGSPNDRRGTIAISAMHQYGEMLRSSPAQDVSAESVLFTLKRLVENTVEDSDHMSAFVENMAERQFRIYGPTDANTNGASSPSFVRHDFGMLVQNLKRIAFFDPNTLKDRYTILAAQACNKKSTNNLERTLIAYRLANIFQELPAPLSESSFSADIRTHHQMMIALVQNLIATNDSTAEVTQTEEPEAIESISDAHNISIQPANDEMDICDFCSAPIRFTDPRNASCTNGHQFPRCGLSFIAIQAPGITKYCGICNTPFFNEEFIITQQVEETPQSQPCQDDVSEMNGTLDSATIAQADVSNVVSARPDNDGDPNDAGQTQTAPSPSVDTRSTRELPATFSRLLFHACDVCIYCGGKFVG